MKWVVALTIVFVVFSFLCWSVTGKSATPLDLFGSGGLFGQTIFLAVPLILGALAGVMCERSGVINVAIEGQMLVGAFAGAMFGTISKNAAIGTIAGMLAGALIAALLAVFAIKYLVNQVVLGVVLNLLALGLTGFLYDAVMAPNSNSYNNVGTLSVLKIPLLGNIPIIGPLLFDQTIIVYLTYVLIFAVDILLFRTRWGLRTRAVGEHPKAADTVGINVRRTRYINVLIGGMLAGLAGASLTIGNSSDFVKNMTGGRGFIALAAVIFGRWSPRGAVGAALLFGFATSLQTVLSFIGTPVQIPSDFLGMLPVPRHGLRGGRSRRASARARCRRRTVRGPMSSARRDVEINWPALRTAAQAAMTLAYAPYSEFAVGAAALVNDGRIVVGCNVENASYGLTLCAECGVVSALAASGGGALVALACVDAAGARADAVRPVPAVAVGARRRRHADRPPVRPAPAWLPPSRCVRA